MWFAIGTFPEQIGEGIREAVDSNLDFQIDRTLDRLNELKDSAEMTVLRNLWSSDTIQREPWGNIFRESLLDLIKNLGIDHEEIETQAGEEGVLTFESDAFNRLFESSTVKKDPPTQLFGLLNNDELWGMCILNEDTQTMHLVEIMDLPEILKSLLTGKKVTLPTQAIQDTITLRELLNLYKNSERPTLIPKHHQFNLLDREVELPFNVDEVLEVTFLGLVNLST